MFPHDSIRKTFTVMHFPVFYHSDTLSFDSLACIILYINDRQFRCSVFTFVQYIFVIWECGQIRNKEHFKISPIVFDKIFFMFFLYIYMYKKIFLKFFLLVAMANRILHGMESLGTAQGPFL